MLIKKYLIMTFQVNNNRVYGDKEIFAYDFPGK